MPRVAVPGGSARKKPSGRPPRCCGGWIQQHGVPLALYTDWKKGSPCRDRDGAGRGSGAADAIRTDVRRAADSDHSGSSPQAKGRVERNHGTHQDRLVKNCAGWRLPRTRPPMRFSRPPIGRSTMRAFRRRPRRPTISIAAVPRRGVGSSVPARRDADGGPGLGRALSQSCAAAGAAKRLCAGAQHRHRL